MSPHMDNNSKNL